VTVKIAVISDVHYDSTSFDSEQPYAALADILLLRAVHRINRLVQPDIVLILGDMVDLGDAPSALNCLGELRDTIGLVHAPVMVLPGNHDPDPETFFSILGPSPPCVEVKGTRFVRFVDPEEPEYNARRLPAETARFAEARAGFDGPIVSVQHVPLFPPGAGDCPYGYVNADEVVASMRAHGVRLAVSGHYHRGMDMVCADGAFFVVAPALCRPPFQFLEIELNDEDVHVRRHRLRLPDQTRLTDTHVHTRLAYCSENMDVGKTLALAEAFGLAGVRFTEHTGQLYFDADTFWSGRYLPRGIDGARTTDRRVDDYFALLSAGPCPREWIGLEVDCDFHGRPVLTNADRARARFFNGAMHGLQELSRPRPDMEKAGDEFLFLLDRFARSGIYALAHPFRVFRRAKQPVPTRLLDPTVGLLRDHGVAAEINFHFQETDVEFVRKCIEAGVKLAFGSDAHNLYEVGEFAPHLELLKTCGFDGDLSDILLTP
jgi:histidinol phosphatase-like PHP family hydrolase/predicted phosphodiesterase